MSRPFPLLSSLFAALTLTLGSTCIQAEDDDTRWYQVEVIIFSHADSSKLDETWLPGTTTDEMPFAAELLYPAEVPNDSVETDTTLAKPELRYVEATLPKQYILEKEAERLAESPEYHLLVHKGWIQSVSRNTEATPVVVDDLLINPEQMKRKPQDGTVWELPIVMGGDAPAQSTEMTPSADAEELDKGIVIDEKEENDPVLDSIPVTHEGPTEQLVFGTVGLKWSRYLHLMVDVTYRRDPQRDLGRIRDENLQDLPSFSEEKQDQSDTDQVAQKENGIIPEAVDFRIKDSRRLRRDRLYFFDHPLFGVLVKVTGYEPPKPEEEESPSNAPSSALGVG